MAYIPPNSTIQLFKNIPLNPDYENTYYFHSRQDDVGETGQNTFFGDRATATFTANSYVRKERGVIKLQAQYENVYDCCYMRYRNTSFEYKWFYAFVLKVEYVNNETVEVTFQPDVMQTWLPYVDYDFEQCFIEREHTADDEYFHNLEPENLEYGDSYILNGNVQEYSFHKDNEGNPADLYVGMLAGKNRLGYSMDVKSSSSFNVNGVFCPLYIYGYPMNDMLSIFRAYSSSQTPLYDDIIAIFMYPARFGITDYNSENPNPPIFTGGFNIITNLTTIDGYHPYNKKLFNYPYTLLNVSNNNGKGADYHWEGWASGESYDTSGGDLSVLNAKLGRFLIKGCIMPPVTASLYPTHYNQVKLQTGFDPVTYDYCNYEEGLVIDNFPNCPWVADTYKAWLAQNKASLTTSLIASALGTAASIGVSAAMPYATPAFMGARIAAGAVSIGAAVAGAQAKVTDAKAMPNQAKGQIMSDYLTAGLERYKFTARPMSIKNEFAQKIDRYFQMYGYACHQSKKPYMHHREKWWYIKTIGCDIHGSLPADDIREICGIFDKGVRFWWDKARIGDYNTANITQTPDFG